MALRLTPSPKAVPELSLDACQRGKGLLGKGLLGKGLLDQGLLGQGMEDVVRTPTTSGKEQYVEV